MHERKLRNNYDPLLLTNFIAFTIISLHLFASLDLCSVCQNLVLIFLLHTRNVTKTEET